MKQGRGLGMYKSKWTCVCVWTVAPSGMNSEGFIEKINFF